MFVQRQDVKIADTETTSSAFSLRGQAIIGLLIPTGFDGTAITFEMSESADPAGSWYPVYDSDGAEVSVAVAADQAYGLSGPEADALASFPWLRLVSDAAMTADRVVKVFTK